MGVIHFAVEYPTVIVWSDLGRSKLCDLRWFLQEGVSGAVYKSI